MEKGKRGRLVLTLKSIAIRVIKQGLYERDFFTYDFVSDDGEHFRYAGQRYAIFIEKRYDVTATSDGFRYGAYQIKRPRFELAGEKGAELFERD